jgi:nucleotide-binding universal stress UspA family protein
MRLALAEPRLELDLLAERSSGDVAQVREILVPSDLTPASDRAFEHAALLAARFGARITLYHVVQTFPELASRAADPHHVGVRREIRDARESLERRLEGSDTLGEILVETDESIQRALVRTLRARRPDLTVMSTHGRGWLAQLYTGSVAETAIDVARRPLLLVREPEHGVALPYRRILVPTDLSPASGRAFPMAAMLARTFGAEVIGLHVAKTPRGDHYFGTSGVTYEVESSMPSEQALADFMGSEFVGVELTPRVLLGRSWDQILQSAKQEHADLIVMSTHGRDSLRDHVIGSHTERVMRHAPCPVLVV